MSTNKIANLNRFRVFLLVILASMVCGGCQSSGRHTVKFGSPNGLSEYSYAATSESRRDLAADAERRAGLVSKSSIGQTVERTKAVVDQNESGATIRQVGFQSPDDGSSIIRPAIETEMDSAVEPNSPGGVGERLRSGNELGNASQETVPRRMFGATASSSDLPQDEVSLDQLLDSVRNCYPEIEIAIGEIETANGKVLASWGDFDQVFSAHSISQPLGFYQTYQNGVGLRTPLFGGGEVYGAYRIGDGNFEPWFGERETNEGGELKAGFSLPLLKDRAIDGRRAKLFSAGFQRDQVASSYEARLLLFQRFATQGYWDWVASGQAVAIQDRLLKLAEKRVGQIRDLVIEEDVPPITEIYNNQLIAKRRNTLIKAQRQLEKTSIKLSMFWRDADCQPRIPAMDQLPDDFPPAFAITSDQLEVGIANALSVRPELAELRAARQEASNDLRYAQNLTLPKLDLKGFAGQDLGGATSSKGDKTPFELQLGVLAEVPLQRREGIGKIQAAQGKLSQVDAKMRFTSDKIRTEVQDAASGVNAAYDQIQQSQQNLDLAQQSLDLAEFAFRDGDKDLIEINIFETAVADAELELLEAKLKHFIYRTIYETAIKARFE